MKKQKITKRDFTKNFITEYKESIFLEENGLYNDAVIGVTTNNRIVYNYYSIRHILFLEHLAKVYNYQIDFELNDDDYEMIEQTLRDFIEITQKTYGKKSPVFCKDEYFIKKTLPTLKEYEQSNYTIHKLI